MSGKQTFVRRTLCVLLMSFFSLACAREVEYTHVVKCKACSLLALNCLSESVVSLNEWGIIGREGYGMLGDEYIRESNGSRISWRRVGFDEIYKMYPEQGHHLLVDGEEIFLDIGDDNVAKIIKRDGTTTAVKIQASSPEKLGEIILSIMLHPGGCKSPWGEDE